MTNSENSRSRSKAHDILVAAFYRSFTCSLPEWNATRNEQGISYCVLGSEDPGCVNLALGKKQKILVFGAPDSGYAAHILPQLGLKTDSSLPVLAEQDTCAVCTNSDHHTESRARVQYADHPLTASLTQELQERPFTRFDFTAEWNNLGFGRICTDSSPWSVSGGITTDGAFELASIRLGSVPGESVYAGSYLTLLDTPDCSVLWCARPVGPVDSTEWSVIERFVSDWRAGDLPCIPCLLQTPANCRAVVTMRLDCDEDISSARDVFEWYAGQGLPFSLAVKTGLNMTSEDLSLLRDVLAHGGTLLSHSHTHRLNWGASTEEVRNEIAASRQWFRDTLPQVSALDLAVSPFHSNPPYAMQVLEESGFRGVVSGIIHNDPEYLLGRAGRIPFTQGRLLSISQQSMLHGDCYRQQGQSMAVHEQAFAMQHAAHGIFGYLDHPFSNRYQYGWDTKAQRLEAHQKLIVALRTYENVWFWNQRQCFDFICLLAKIHLGVDSKGAVQAKGVDKNCAFRPVCRLGGEEYIL